MLRRVAQKAAEAVPLPLDGKQRALVVDLLYGAARRFWNRLSAKERGAVTRNPGKLVGRLCIELVNPRTRKPRSPGAVVGALLESMRPASYIVTKGRRRRRRVVR